MARDEDVTQDSSAPTFRNEKDARCSFIKRCEGGLKYLAVWNCLRREILHERENLFRVVNTSSTNHITNLRHTPRLAAIKGDPEPAFACGTVNATDRSSFREAAEFVKFVSDGNDLRSEFSALTRSRSTPLFDPIGCPVGEPSPPSLGPFVSTSIRTSN